MSIRRQQRIKDYVTDVLYNVESDDGSRIRRISHQYKKHYLTRIKQLNFTLETFSSGIEAISESLFCMRKPTMPYVISLLIFSIELDIFYKHHSWYTTDMLTQTLVSILLKTTFNPSYKQNRCCILYSWFFSCFTLSATTSNPWCYRVVLSLHTSSLQCQQKKVLKQPTNILIG